MSDHPVTLHRNLFYSQRHLLRSGTSKAEAKSKITHEPKETIGVKNIGKIKQGFKASLEYGAKTLSHMPLVLLWLWLKEK
jgi:imidazolonepropionase-like amidohydrolase